MSAQTDSVLIENIFLVGNKQTCDDVVLREITIELGEKVTYKDLSKKIEESRINLINSKLYNYAKINFKEESEGLGYLEVEMDETWFIYPAPIFEYADRNFNVWWNEHNHDWSRVNLGVRLDHFNLTGHRDVLKAKVQWGYTHKYELEYNYPFLNSSGTWGINMGYLYSSNNEVGYIAQGNKLAFYKEDDFILHKRRFTLDIYHRPKYRRTHNFKLEYYNNDISQSVLEGYNPDFFNGQRQRINYFVFEYEYIDNQLDHFTYPMSGYRWDVKLRKEGLGIYNHVNLLSFGAAVEWFQKLGKRWGHAHKIKGRVQAFRDNPGYYHYTALGYDDNQIRGYELYVVDGLDFIYSQHRINYKLMDIEWQLGEWMFLNQFRRPHVQLYFSLEFENGFANSPYFNSENDLNNKWLVGGGPSFDLLLYNHFIFQVEYSLNGLGEKNLFLHFNINF